jgi:hypothetical protein
VTQANQSPATSLCHNSTHELVGIDSLKSCSVMSGPVVEVLKGQLRNGWRCGRRAGGEGGGRRRPSNETTAERCEHGQEVQDDEHQDRDDAHNDEPKDDEVPHLVHCGLHDELAKKKKTASLVKVKA